MSHRLKSLLFTLLFAFQAQSADDSFNLSQTDKQLHAVSSMALMFVSSTFFKERGRSFWRSALYGSLVTIGVGAAKEALDSEFSKGDMYANLAGTGVGFGLFWTIDGLSTKTCDCPEPLQKKKRKKRKKRKKKDPEKKKSGIFSKEEFFEARLESYVLEFGPLASY